MVILQQLCFGKQNIEAPNLLGLVCGGHIMDSHVNKTNKCISMIIDFLNYYVAIHAHYIWFSYHKITQTN